ncbi:hypothetical protein LAZ67_2001606 [Cordylochernes scorpioides]|uniref:Uncharacterized protein n=1 Tax=Cordylochernes scorpioides TaxID=51811 RepID=A0ABY6K1C9_9ARAC|nr:hypothetical protein LAZ67_2001606 [Cordylochernes scorpioides]
MVLVDGILRYTGELHCLGMEADTEQPALRIQENFTGGENLPEQGSHGSATPISVATRRWTHRRHSWHVSRQDGVGRGGPAVELRRRGLFKLYQCLAKRFVLITNICQSLKEVVPLDLKKVVGQID